MLVSKVGNVLAQLAIPWYVLSTTGSAGQTGLTAFAGLLPQLLSSFFGGTFVDRLGFRRAGIIADLVSALSVAAIPVLAMTLGLPFWLLLALVFLGALLDTSGDTARDALRVELANRSGIPLERANGLGEFAMAGPYLVAPLAAGALMAWIGAEEVLWLNAISFAISAAILVACVPGQEGRGRQQHSEGYWSEVMAGLRYVYRDKVLWWFMVFNAAIAALITPLPGVLLPVWIREASGSPLDLGLLVTAFGLGFLAGVVLYGAVGDRLPRLPVAVTAVVGLGLTAGVLAFHPPLWLTFGAMLLGGIVYGPLSPLMMSVAGERAPEEMRARVFGMLAAISLAMTPLGVLVVGFGIQAFGVSPFAAGTGLGLVALAAGMAIHPAMRRLDETRRPNPA